MRESVYNLGHPARARTEAWRQRFGAGRGVPAAGNCNKGLLMEKWLILICAASVIALAGCGPDLSTPEGRYNKFRTCARHYSGPIIQERLVDPDSYESRSIY